MQREHVHLRAQRTPHQRLPATIAADPTIALTSALAERCAALDLRRSQTRQQLVAYIFAAFRRGIRVHPLPRLAQRPVANPLHQRLHVGVVHLLLRMKLRPTATGLPAVYPIQPQNVEVYVQPQPRIAGTVLVCYRLRVRQVQTFSACLLAVPLIGSSVNHVFQVIEPPMNDGSQGARMWEIIRDGGLMNWLAVGHALIGLLLLVPRTRFAAGVLQLPITMGIVAFNVTMFPAGVALALAMIVVNLGVVLRGADLRRLIAPPAS